MIRAAATLVAAALAMPALGGTAAAQIRCPSELTVTEQPVAPPGMRGEAAQRTRRLQRVAVFDGVPSEKKELRPSRTAQESGGTVQVFELPNPRLRPTIIVCRYADTTVTLTAPVPAANKRCTVRLGAIARGRQQVECG
jgi:hypothetical protein